MAFALLPLPLYSALSSICTCSKIDHLHRCGKVLQVFYLGKYSWRVMNKFALSTLIIRNSF